MVFRITGGAPVRATRQLFSCYQVTTLIVGRNHNAERRVHNFILTSGVVN